ncbi:MAG: PD-(D/E)XK nuclease family protein [Nitrospira sp.]|nr:PD-(D/E)XK nuclease family protein [Nitrospira sp.]
MDLTSNTQIETAKELIEKAGEILCTQEKNDRKSGRRFNIFNALGVERSEHPHSRFLACLLDPQGLHDQKDLFLRAFLRDVICEQADMPDLMQSEVRTEVPIWSGRLDVLIILSDGQMVALENKVQAGEGEAQLERYRKWLHSRPQSESGRPHHLVFLTPEGRLPSSCSSPDIKCISYTCITDWLLQLKDEMPDPLKIIIDQYVNLWRGVPMNSEMHALVSDSKNFDTAESISKAVEEVKAIARGQFLNRIQQDLQNKLEATHLSSAWEAIRTHHTDKFAGCGLLWKDRNPNLTGKDFFSQQFTLLCELQDDSWEGKQLIVGVCRGAKVQKESQVVLDKEISQRLLSDQRFEQSPYWPGYVKLKDLIGGRTIGVKELIIEGHQLSKLVADELWKLFEVYRKELEDLNRNYPY